MVHSTTSGHQLSLLHMPPKEWYIWQICCTKNLGILMFSLMPISGLSKLKAPKKDQGNVLIPKARQSSANAKFQLSDTIQPPQILQPAFSVVQQRNSQNRTTAINTINPPSKSVSNKHRTAWWQAYHYRQQR